MTPRSWLYMDIVTVLAVIANHFIIGHKSHMQSHVFPGNSCTYCGYYAVLKYSIIFLFLKYDLVCVTLTISDEVEELLPDHKCKIIWIKVEIIDCELLL